MLSALWVDGAAKLTGGIILTKSDKTEKRELKVPHLFFFNWETFTFILYPA